MANEQILQLLEFANLQMAAEAFLSQSGDLIPGRPPEGEIETRLEDGNTHNSRFTSVQAQRFVDTYEVLAQYRNDPLLGGGSGFSGTLFRNRTTGELTLSFRSTEFIDDAVRDNKATNELEIKNIGWAFGQIAEMEAWYAQLRADPNLLGGHSFNVTGYSLGGHLATAFNILRQEEYAAAPQFNPVLETYTFNGAGTGAILGDRRLSDLLADFNRIRTDYASSPEWAALSPGDQATVTALAQARIDEINSERFRVGGLTGVPWAFAASAPSGSQILLGYQIAAILVGQHTIGASNFPLFGGVNDIPSSPIFVSPALRIPGITEVVGMETEGLATSFVSNSGVHYGERLEVPIEAQPTFRGSWPVIDLVRRNLLIDNPGENDFGDTHSLALLVDSLSLLAVMERLDAEFTPELGMEIFAAASNARASQSLGTQGAAEGDTLERVLDALHELVYGSAPESGLDYEAVLAGNTWHLNDYRAPFHERLAELNAAIEEAAANPGAPDCSIISLADYSAEEIAFFASRDDATGMAYRYALRELNPFALIADDDFYAPHNIGGELELGGNPAAVAGLSNEWIADRAAFLAWNNLDSIENGQEVLRGAQVQSFVYEQRDDLGTANLALTVVGRAASDGNVGAAANPVRVVFGGAGADNIVGGNLNDRLYGESGADTLHGSQGNDYLEGGAGNDTYVWNAGDGFDTILDTDGVGRLLIDGTPLSGVIQITQNDYISADKRFVLRFEGDPAAGGALIVNGDLRIDNFTDGDLGISLAAAGTIHDVQPAVMFVPDLYSIRFRGQFGTDNDDYYVLADGTNFGGSVAFLGLDGDDLLIAPDSNPWFTPEAYGGHGDDVIVTNRVLVEGNESGGYAEGEGGRDYLVGSAAADRLFGDTSLGTLRFEESGSAGSDYFSFYRYFSSNSPDAYMPSLYYDGNTRNAHYIDGETNGDPYGPAIGFADDGIAGAFEWLGLTSPGAEPGVNDDYISAGGGDDYLVGGAGGDELYGGDGNDMVVGGLIGGGGTLFRNTAELLYSPATDGQYADSSFALEASRAGEANIGFVRGLMAQAGDDYLDGGDGNDFMRDRDGGSDVLLGSAGDDILLDDDWIDNFHPVGPPASAVFNYLDGGDGSDVINVSNRSPGGFDVVLGGDGDDRIQYWAGNGYLNGGTGSDRYESVSFLPIGNIFSYSLLSQIVISDFSNEPGEVDELWFDAVVLDPSLNFSMSRDDTNLYIGISGNDRWITVENWFVGQEYKIERFVFDFYWTPEIEQVYDITAIESRFQVATDSADFLWGGGAEGVDLAGGLGDDELFGSEASDRLAGNEGSDRLDGGHGADLYVFNAGDGADRIEDTGQADSDGISFGPGITMDQLNWNPGTLTLSIGANGDLIRLGSAGTGPGASSPGGIEYLQFADGATMVLRQITDPTFVPPAPDSRGPVWVPGVYGPETIPGAGGGTGGSPDGGGGSGVPGGGDGDGTGTGGNDGGNSGQPDTGGGGIPGGTGGSGGNGSGDPGQPDTGGGTPGGSPGGEPDPAGPDGVGGVDDTPANTVLAVNRRIEDATTSDFFAFDDMPDGNLGALAGEASQEGRAIAELIDSYFRDQPVLDSNTFARHASPGSGRAETMSPREIAKRWQLIAKYLDQLEELTDEDARGGAGEWRPIDYASLASNGGVSGQAFGHAGSTGATRGFANLKTFQGLSEGFVRIPMQS